MPVALATVRLTASNGVFEDAVNNTFCFEVPAIDAETADDIRDALASFYNTEQIIPGADHSISDFISPAITRAANACKVFIYDITADLAGTPHGSPLFTRSFTLGNADVGVGFPSEVAIVGSFHADLDGLLEVDGATRPASRRRGRVFIGPVTDVTAVYDVGNQARVSQDAMDTINASMLLLSGAVGGAWSVWSRSNASVEPVVGGWTENAFDTQRRRGPVYSVRTTWSSV